MNIAVLFSGRVIGFEQSLPLYEEHIFKNNNVHIFIAHNSYNKEDLSKLLTYNNVHIISEYYIKPSDCLIKFSQGQDPHGYYLASQWYHKYKAYEMMNLYGINNNIIFDIVISSRLDILIENSFIFDIVNENTLYVPNHSDWCGLNYQFAFGTVKTMKVYCDLYNKIDKPVTFNPEVMLNEYIQSTGLNINRIELNYKFIPKRHIHNLDRHPFFNL